ncbi:hypothetical protein V7157_28640 [Neobacillus drentensis]|uniref:hypothetical protein n=1 Tax=Neobacillus drentensis TaxID=220684 RepID=UPI003001175C
MKKYRVGFRFNKEDATSFIMNSDNAETMYGYILSHKEWLKHVDEKGNLHVVNMKNVNYFYIQEYKPANVSVKGF